MKIIFCSIFEQKTPPENCCDALSYCLYIFGIYYDWLTSEHELFFALEIEDKRATVFYKITIDSMALSHCIRNVFLHDLGVCQRSKVKLIVAKSRRRKEEKVHLKLNYEHDELKDF